jgi:hypothetical protein
VPGAALGVVFTGLVVSCGSGVDDPQAETFAVTSDHDIVFITP